MQFFTRDGGSSQVLVPKKAQDPKRPQTLEFSLDILNRTQKIGFCDAEMNELIVYVSVYTNEFSKVFEISDEPSKHIF